MSEKPPQTPEETLALIKEAAGNGRIDFAPDSLTAKYDYEIQTIFSLLYFEKRGEKPKRKIWTADGVTVGFVLDYNADTKDYTPESYEICKRVGEQLGISLTPRTVWEEAAAELRSKNPTTVKS
jgi:hypothetical protein